MTTSPQSGFGHHELLALHLQLLVTAKYQDRLEEDTSSWGMVIIRYLDCAGHQEDPHGQLPDEDVLRELFLVLSSKRS